METSINKNMIKRSTDNERTLKKLKLTNSIKYIQFFCEKGENDRYNPRNYIIDLKNMYKQCINQKNNISVIKSQGKTFIKLFLSPFFMQIFMQNK